MTGASHDGGGSSPAAGSGSRDTLIMFSKAPVPGRVKTRLAVEIGAVGAADLQAAFIRDLGRRFARFDGRRVLACEPDTTHAVFQELTGLGWTAATQGAGDLGARLMRALNNALGQGARGVVFIGSDSPSLPAQLVSAAFEVLSDRDVVLGPVFDGGYYLVGARAARLALFKGIPWGTERVFPATVRQLEAAGVSYGVLPFWYDIDDLESLRRLAEHVGLQGPYGRFEAAASEAALRKLGILVD